MGLVHVSTRRLDTATAQVLAVVLLVAPLAIGGVHAQTVVALLGACLLAALIRAYALGRRGGRFTVHPFGLVLFLLAGFAALQCIPLPLSWVEFLSPEAAARYREAMALAGSAMTDRWVPLSLDAATTAVEAARFAAVGLVFLVVTDGAIREEGSATATLKAVAISGAVLVMFSVAQTLAGHGVLFGLYTPVKDVSYQLFSTPFINENHLAGFLNLTGLTALGLAYFAEEGRERVFFGAVFCACFLGVLASLSRGGIMAGTAGALAFLALASWRGGHGRQRRAGPALAVGLLVLLAGAAGIAYEVVGSPLERLLQLDQTFDAAKLTSTAAVVPVLRDFPFVGTGVGALGDVFARYNELAPGVEVSHAENFILDLAVGFGLPVALVALGFGVVTLAPALGRAPSRYDTLGAGVALYAVLLQNLVDFSLWTAGVALPAAALAAVVVATAARERAESGRKAPLRSLRPISMTPLVPAVVALAALAFTLHGRFGDRAVDAAIQEAVADAAPADAPVSESSSPLAELAVHRPADHHVFLAGSVVELKSGRPARAKEWLEAARQRAPHAFGPELLAARLAASEGRASDAISAFGQLLRTHWGSRERIFPEMMSALGSPEAMERAAPEAEEEALALALWLELNGHKDWSERFLRARLQTTPGAYTLRFERALTLVELEVDAAEVDMEATQLMARHPDRAGGYFIQGLLFERSREWQNALVMFREAQRAEPAYAFAGLGEARVLLELGDSPGFRERVGSLRPLVRNVPEQRAELLRLASLHAERDGRFEDALMEMELAVQAAPGNVQLHVGLARLRAKVSDNLGARAALEQALLLSPGFPPARAALDELSRKATAAGDLPD